MLFCGQIHPRHSAQGNNTRNPMVTRLAANQRGETSETAIFIAGNAPAHKNAVNINSAISDGVDFRIVCIGFRWVAGGGRSGEQ